MPPLFIFPIVMALCSLIGGLKTHVVPLTGEGGRETGEREEMRELGEGGGEGREGKVGGGREEEGQRGKERGRKGERERGKKGESEGIHGNGPGWERGREDGTPDLYYDLDTVTGINGMNTTSYTPPSPANATHPHTVIHTYTHYQLNPHYNVYRMIYLYHKFACMGYILHQILSLFVL